MSFYTSMASTASRLIGTYGRDVMLVRDNDSIDPVTGVTTSGGTTRYKLKGIFKLYPDSLIDGARITASDRAIILDNKIEPLLTDKVDISGQEWNIESIKTSEPANEKLVYFLQIRR